MTKEVWSGSRRWSCRLFCSLCWRIWDEIFPISSGRRGVDDCPMVSKFLYVVIFHLECNQGQSVKQKACLSLANELINQYDV
jgi:hypothetical protein